MELSTIKLHSCKEKGKVFNQMTLDDDYNVPDYRPDIIKVLKEKGEILFDEITSVAGAVWLKGRLSFRILYRSNQENGKISCLKGEIPFQEKINMEGLLEEDKVQVKAEIEDLTISVIHSRKLSIRSVVTLQAGIWLDQDKKICCGVETDIKCEQNMSEQEVLQLIYQKHDTCRQRTELSLPSSKPNIQEILWKSIELRNVGSQISTEGVKITGEALISILYSEEEEVDRIQWYETVVPLDCAVACELLQDDADTVNNCIYKVGIDTLSKDIEVKPDYDGEERMLVMELNLSLDIRIWQEKIIERLEDIYSLEKKIIPVNEKLMLEKFFGKNEAQCRVTERMELGQNQEKILQICSCEGVAKVENKEIRDGGIFVEGIIDVELLYITTDDKMPLGVAQGVYPFEQFVEIPDLETNKEKNNVLLELESRLNQLSAVMLDQEHVEIKAVIGLNVLAFDEVWITNITEIKEEPLDIEQLRKRPGFVGYVAKEGDSLWKIAKENHTTVEEIMKNNKRKEEQLKKGEKILIVKNVC